MQLSRDRRPTFFVTVFFKTIKNRCKGVAKGATLENVMLGNGHGKPSETDG